MIDRLNQVRQRRCIVVEGPAGSGKTSLIVAWRQALLTMKVDVAWLTLSPEDDEPRRFWMCVLASFARINRDLVVSAMQLLDRDDDPATDELWVITLVQSLATMRDELVLVLDDVQHVQHSRIGQMLQWLLDYAPARFHLVLISRSNVPLALERRRAQGQLAEFDLDDLRFSSDEAGRFLRGQIPGIRFMEVERLHRATDGWVAGLQLIAIGLKAGQGHDKASRLMQDARAFADYFETEVLRCLSPEDLEVLMHCAISDRFCAPLCAALLRQKDVMAMEGRLSRLVRADLFVSRVSGNRAETWYRIHPLLREVLLSRLDARSAVVLRGLHRIAWHWFEARGAIDEAVRHAVLANEASEGAKLVEKHAEWMIAHNGMAQLGIVMRSLPSRIIENRFGLRLLMGHLNLAVRNLSAVEADINALQQALAQSASVGDRKRWGLTVLQAGLAMQRDDSDAILALQKDLEAVADDAPALEVARRGQALAWLHMNRGEHEAAREALDKSEHARITEERRLMGDAFRGMSLAVEGRLGEAEIQLRSVLERATRRPDHDGSVVCIVAGLLCDPLYESNALVEVRALMEPRIELMERTVMPDILLRAMTVLSSTHWICGSRLEALATAQRLEEHALRYQLDRALAQSLLLQLRWQLRSGRIQAAEILRERIEKLGERHAQAAPGTLAHVLRVVRRARAAVSLHWNDFSGARQHLHESLVNAQTSERWREVAATRMQLVLAASRDHREAEAWTHLDVALRLGHRMGLLRSLLDAGPDVPAVLRAWQDRFTEAAEPVMVFYVGRLIAAAEQTRAAFRSGHTAASSESHVELSDRECEVLAMVARAMSNKKIARALDISPHTVKFHLRNIYLKLGVNERDQALARWREIRGTGLSRD